MVPSFYRSLTERAEALASQSQRRNRRAALAQPLFAARHDDIGYGLDLLAGYLKRNWISYDKDDPDCQHYIRVAAWDYVLGPIANRVL